MVFIHAISVLKPKMFHNYCRRWEHERPGHPLYIGVESIYVSYSVCGVLGRYMRGLLVLMIILLVCYIMILLRVFSDCSLFRFAEGILGIDLCNSFFVVLIDTSQIVMQCIFLFFCDSFVSAFFFCKHTIVYH